MKRTLFALGLVAATAFAAPLAAQSRNDGPWWDPANTGNRGTDSRDGRVYDDGRIYDNGRVYDSRNTDGRWRRVGRDRNGNYIYARNRYDSNRNLIQELARRDSYGRYRVYDRRVVQHANRRNDRYDNDRNNDGWEDRRNGRDRNDRWDQNNGHDNGRHNGQYKNKNKNKGKNGRRG